ncbi:MAG: hypothetical protein ACO3SJ_09325 [Phycisphaerales bacterium]
MSNPSRSCRRTAPVVLASGVAAVLALGSSALASPTFATYSGSNAGSVNGVGFTMSGLAAAQYQPDIQSLGMTGSDWNNVGAQQGRIYDANTTTTFTVTFASPVSGLQMYLYYFRGAAGGGGGYASYDFAQAFTITGGLGSPTTQSGTALNTPSGFANGVITFTGPVTTLTVTATGSANGGDQGFTFAVVPVAVPGGAGFAAAMAAGLGLRRRRR